jgi:hypothetical protein
VTARGEVATVPEVGYVLRHHGGPRQISRTEDRLRCRLLLVESHPEYFGRHARAAAYQWKRAGGLAQSIGDQALARVAFLRSLRLHPHGGTLWHLLTALRPSTASAGRLIDLSRSVTP